MWITKAEYTALVSGKASAEATRDWALTQINMLQTEVGQLKLELTGKPQPVPRFRMEAAKPVDPFLIGETSFEDLGDEEAKANGYNVLD